MYLGDWSESQDVWDAFGIEPQKNTIILLASYIPDTGEKAYVLFLQNADLFQVEVDGHPFAGVIGKWKPQPTTWQELVDRLEVGGFSVDFAEELRNIVIRAYREAPDFELIQWMFSFFEKHAWMSINFFSDFSGEVTSDYDNQHTMFSFSSGKDLNDRLIILKKCATGYDWDGYYWKQTGAFTDKEWDDLLSFFFAVQKTRNIPLAGYNTIGTPRAGKYSISFNGAGKDYGMPFGLLKEPDERFGFCKTNKKPYDLVVSLMLLKAHELAPDRFMYYGGGNEENWAFVKTVYDRIHTPVEIKITFNGEEHTASSVAELFETLKDWGLHES